MDGSFNIGPAPSQRKSLLGRVSLSAGAASHADGEDRPEYANNFELLLTLVGYAVGLGNIWRFPYLAYTYGGGAFLVPYFISLALLGLPLFILEMGLGQMFRQGTLGVWSKLQLPKLQGVGIAATICTFLVMLYYNVILAWTIYYIGRTIAAIPSGVLPWSDMAEGYTCPATLLYARKAVAENPYLYDKVTGLYNKSYDSQFWCPPLGIPTNKTLYCTPEELGSATCVGDDFVPVYVKPQYCPARAAASFWEDQVLQQSSGMDNPMGLNYGLALSLTIAWLCVFGIVFNGVQSSGKVVYVTALLPYFALIIFFFRAVTLPGAAVGIEFYLMPDPAVLYTSEVWIRAATQIFYSLGVGFGSLIAFASYSSKTTDFVKQSTQVACINCGTSFFAGFVVFPILGFLCLEMSDVNPCMEADNLGDLKSIGLSGTGLAFIAFPIAIDAMAWGKFFWAFLFFIMLFCLGIDSQFAMVESVMTVVHDAKIGHQYGKTQVTAMVCGLSWFLGIILFTTKAGIYWFNLFDYYSCVVAMFLVTIMECIGVSWMREGLWEEYAAKVKAFTGRELGPMWLLMYKFVCPVLISGLLFLAFKTFDIMGAGSSVAFPEGSGYLPPWSIYAGWFVGLVPVAGFVFGLAAPDLSPSTGPAPDLLAQEAKAAIELS